MHKLSAVGHHRVGFTSKEEEQGLHEQDPIRGDVRHGTKNDRWQQRMAVAWRVAKMEPLGIDPDRARWTGPLAIAARMHPRVLAAAM